MKREMQVALCLAAKALGYGVVGVKAEIATLFGVPMASLVQKGKPIPGSQTRAPEHGYYCPRSNPLGVPTRTLTISEDDAPTRTVYRLVELREDSTGHGSFEGRHDGHHAAEMLAYLRGLIDSASALRARAAR